MKQFNTLFLTFVFGLIASLSLSAQNRFFSDAVESNIQKARLQRTIVPLKYRTVEANSIQLKTFLWSLPAEKNVSDRSQAPILELPMPNGTIAKFHVWESSIQEPGLQAKFPDIKTFTGQGIDDPYATIRFDFTPRGFHAQVLTVNGTYYIDPYAMDDTENYISYFRKDLAARTRFICGVQDPVIPGVNRPADIAAPCRGTDLRTYRLAVACTGEYAQAPGVSAGANAALLHAAIVTTVNRVVGVYEMELALRLVLVANNNLIEYLSAGTDPFNGNNNANTLITESQTVITANIGSANYDIGHTFSTGGGGLAGLGVVCTSSQKARGITGSPSPTGDAYDIDYVAHEMGHQWGGNHTMAGCGSSPNSTKYEPGSGTTIQAYAGICGPEDIQPNSDPTFHAVSFDEISNYLAGTGASCGVSTPTGNTLPVINPLPNNGLSIPPGTPFTLTGSATDANGDALTYCWEEWDFSGAATWNAGATAAAGNTVPLFKSRLPKTTGSRTFPDIAVILAGFPANPPAALGGLKGETLSPVARPMKFRLTVRDNRAGGGGIVSSGGGGCQTPTVLIVNVVGTTPFTLSAPNGGEIYPGGSTQTITWNVAGTNAAPVSAANVKISLSTDGGLTYPTVISASTANDGTEALTIPSGATTTARIKVEAVGNIFFDISNANFTITAAASGYTFNSVAPATIACGTASASITLATTAQGGFTTPINLAAAGNPAGTNVSFAPNPLTPGNSSVVTLNNTNTLVPGTYNITITGTAGSIVQTSSLSYIIQPGTAPTVTTQPAPVEVCAGANATFTVVAPGAGLSYQWQVSTDGGATFTNISGANSASYTLTGVVAAQNNNQYQVIVSTLCGTTTTIPATLTVNAPAAISSQPADASVCVGNDITFSVAVTGSNLTYQWQQSTTGCGGTFFSIPAASTSSYTISGVTIGQNNYAYQVIITGACTTGSITSSCATLTVSSSVGITTQPSNELACEGSDAQFIVVPSGSGVNIQWQVSTDNGVTYTNIPGATNDTLTISGVTAALTGNLYQAVLTNATCSTPSTSTAATLTVNSLPSVTTQPVSVTGCIGSNATFTTTATGTGITYQWQVSTDGGVTFTNIAGEISPSLTINAITTGQNSNQYHVVVSGTCSPAITSNNATLTVISNATLTTQPDNVAACDGTDASFTVVANGGGGPANYQWQVSIAGGGFTNIPGATNATLTLTSVTASMNGNQYQVIISNAACAGTVTSNVVTLTINGSLSISASADFTSVCTGSTVTLTGSGAGASGVYTWGPVGLSGSTVQVTPTVLPGNPGVPNANVYTVTGTDVNGCSGTATVTVTANPLPLVTLTASPANTNLLPGQSVVLTATVTPPGSFILTWEKDGVVIPNFSGSSITAGVSELGLYTVTASDATGGCASVSNSINVSDSATTTFYIFPNPNNGSFYISYHNPGGIPIKRNVTVFDSHGARVYNKSLNVTLRYDLIKVDLRPAASGVYIVVLFDGAGNRLAAEKVVVQ